MGKTGGGVRDEDNHYWEEREVGLGNFANAGGAWKLEFTKQVVH